MAEDHPLVPPEVLERHPELGLYEFTPSHIRWAQVPGSIQILMATFIPDRGWLTTKASVIYGGHHGPPPLIEDDEDTVVEILTHEVRAGVRAMQHKLRHG